MNETINLPPFALSLAFTNDQLSELLEVIYSQGPAYNVVDVHLLTPAVSMTRNGRTATSEARTQRIFSADLTEGGELKRSHHNINNNLTVSQYQGTLRLTTQNNDDQRYYDVAFVPTEGSVFDAKKAVKDFAKNLKAHLPASGQPFAIRPQSEPEVLHLRELSEFLDILNPLRPTFSSKTESSAPAAR